jgi:hypothetical protein
MQVKFSKSVAIDISKVDKRQYGRLIRVVPTIPPEFGTDAEGKATVKDATTGPAEWHVRINVPIDLPQDVAEAFIDSGVAELVTDTPVVRWGAVEADGVSFSRDVPVTMANPTPKILSVSNTDPADDVI